jgi:ATP-dependent Clp protease ATP-binding subunit ClpC
MTIKNYSQNVSRVLMLAALEARMARQDVIDTDHLLLAILHDEGDNLARKILE